MGKTFEICDFCREEMQVLWAIEVGRMTVHMYSNLSELYRLREHVNEMIDGLEAIQKEKQEAEKQRQAKRNGHI